MATKNLGLPVERQVPCKLRDGNRRDQRDRRQAVLDQPWRRLRLYHSSLAAPAAIARPADALDLQDRRDDVQLLAHILADQMHRTLAARAGLAVRLDHLLAARQVL